MTINGVRVATIGQHYVAFPTDAPRCAQREAQASVIRGIINAEADSKEIILFGDYNDYSDDVPDSSNDQPTSHVMQILRSGLTSTENTTVLLRGKLVPITVAANPTLYETSQLVPQSVRYSNAYDVDKLSMIDHILVSQRIANAITNVVYDHTYARDTVSDHWPIYIDINTPF